MKIDWDYITNNLQWVVKVPGYRFKGNLIECNKFYERNIDEVKDFDLCAVQPPELEEFVNDYYKFESEYGFISVPQFYKVWDKRR